MLAIAIGTIPVPAEQALLGTSPSAALATHAARHKVDPWAMLARVFYTLKVPCSRRPRVGGKLFGPRCETYAALILPEGWFHLAKLVNWGRLVR